MTDRLKSIELAADAAKQLIDHIERLAGDTWIDVDRTHIPVRKSLHFVDGPGSGWGARIPFNVYKKVIERVYSDRSKLEDREPPVADAENDAFSRDIDTLMGQGFDLDTAIETAAGSGNLQMLFEGALSGFVEMIKGILPQLPIPETLTEPIDPVKDFMMAGINQTPPEVDNFLSRLSPGWIYLRSKEHDSAHLKVLNYAYSYAVNNTGTNVAKLWEAWAAYPTLKEVHLAATLQAKSMRVDDGRLSNIAGQYLDRQIQDWNIYIRRTAILFSNVLAHSAVCCIVGTIMSFEKARNFINTARSVVQAIIKFNSGVSGSISLSTANFSQAAQHAIASAIATSIDQSFHKQVEGLRKLWDRVQESLGDVDCIPLTQIFDGLVGILADRRDDIFAQLRSIVRWEDAHWQKELQLQNKSLETYSYQNFLRLLDTVDRILDIEARCQVDSDSVDRRAVDIIRKLRFESSLNIHIEGAPLPEGLDPESPLANLKPITIPSGLTIEPGIQGSDLPIEELEDLFRKCRQGRFTVGSELTLLPGIFKRK